MRHWLFRNGWWKVSPTKILKFSNFRSCYPWKDQSWRTRRASNSNNPDTTISLGPIKVPKHVPVEIKEVFIEEKIDILSKNQMFDHSTIRIPREYILKTNLSLSKLFVASLLWTLVFTLLASAIALATILVRWLAEDRKLNQAFLNSPTRSRTDSIHTDTSTTEISAWYGTLMVREKFDNFSSG